MYFKGIAKVDKKTKRLAKRIGAGEIAVINHMDIDEVAANSLVEAKIGLVINADKSISGRYPNKGPGILAANNILIIDNVGIEAFNSINEGDHIEINEGIIFKDKKEVGNGKVIDKKEVDRLIALAYENIENELDKFIDNTIDYARREKGLILGSTPIPKVKTDFNGRHVLIVVRGQDYKQDLETIITYIEDEKPILIGVDGGADALLEFGYVPDMIVGDMDSVTDRALKSTKEIVVHAYVDGRAPGLSRVEALGLEAVTFPAPGTSEDIAMLLAYENKAELIVALGTHSNMIDFLEKGRRGMASTFLVRLKIGSKLVDAKGVNLLYTSKLKPKYVLGLVVAAFFPILIMIMLSPRAQYLLQLLQLKARLLLRM